MTRSIHATGETRRPGRRRLAGALATLALVAVIAGVAGCRGDDRAPPPRLRGAGAAAPRAGGTLRISFVDDVRTLDPAIAYDEFSLVALDLLGDTLVGYAASTDPEPTRLAPRLAERWSVSHDGRVYAFTLRPGLRYADGTPIVADDFVAALERVLDPDGGSPGADFFASLEGATAYRRGESDRIAGARALDDRHLELRLERPDASFPLVLAMKFVAPVPRAYAARMGAELARRPLASGPYDLAAWSPGERLVFRRNPRYWAPGVALLDEIVIDLQVPRDVAALKFHRGELHALDRLSGDEYLRFVRSPAWAPYVLHAPEMNVYGEMMDVRRPPFSDRRVRQALNYALDKESTVKIYNGRAIVAHGVLPPLMPGYDPALPPYPHDPARARALLAEAGYPDGFDVTYTTWPDEYAQRLAQSIQADLAQVGVRVTIRTLTFPAYLSAVGKGEIPFGLVGWTMDFPDAWNFLEVKFHSRFIAPENSPNEARYSNPELDRLLDRARAELDPDRRLTLYRRAERILYEDCPWIWHYHGVAAEVVQPIVRGYRPHPVWRRSFRGVWLDLPAEEIR